MRSIEGKSNQETKNDCEALYVSNLFKKDDVVLFICLSVCWEETINVEEWERVEFIEKKSDHKAKIKNNEAIELEQ